MSIHCRKSYETLKILSILSILSERCTRKHKDGQWSNDKSSEKIIVSVLCDPVELTKTENKLLMIFKSRLLIVFSGMYPANRRVETGIVFSADTVIESTFVARTNS